ncbi:hypothetical protein [Methanolapillus millepedarum]|uniref:DUF4177 domain-containing protein n=1 Tax=Methanolapillus millepedarum TaxID=3028296 RepID=A0AA96V526_9EURY|nr:hypothetical protein MsAc7_15330 [Methanosarcinaceae archaeon Ac7]
MSIEVLEPQSKFFEIGIDGLVGSGKSKHQKYESLLDCEYEMDIVDELNIVEQINAYAVQGWKFASICGEFIIFKRPIRFTD